MNESEKRDAPLGGYREVLRVAYPLIISMGSFTLMQFSDRMFLAWYSATAIQAALPAGILSFTLICTFMALAGYANTFVAQYHGAGDATGCSRSTVQGVILALASWPVMLALMPVGRLVLRVSGHAPEVYAEELIYFNILMIGSVTSPLGAALSSFYTGRGDTLTNMYAHVAGNVVNIVLDYGMIFGRWGFPEMGIAGAAWATVIAGFVAPAIFAVLYFGRRMREEYRTVETLRFDGPLMARMIRFGLPSAIHLLLDVGSFSVFVLLVGRLGAVALAASNIALAVNGLAFMPLLGISMAATILVGQYQGRRDSASAERATWTSMKLAWMYMFVVALTFVLFPRLYFELFTARGAPQLDIEQLLPVGRWLLVMMAAWGMIDAASLVFAGALKGAGDTRFVMIYSVVVSWFIWITGEVLLIAVFKLGVIPAWIWLTIYVFLLAAGFAWRFQTGAWKEIELLEPTAPITPDRPGAEALAVGD